MFTVIVLKDAGNFARERWEQLPDVLEYQGQCYSLRAGPRQPLATDRQWDPVAVYAPDEISEEEFQDLYHAHRGQVEEFSLHY